MDGRKPQLGNGCKLLRTDVRMDVSPLERA